MHCFYLILSIVTRVGLTDLDLGLWDLENLSSMGQSGSVCSLGPCERTSLSSLKTGCDHLGTPRTCSGSGAEVQVEGGQAGEAFIFLCKPSPPSAHMFFSTSRDSILQSLSGLPSGAKRRADDSRTRHSLCHGCG